MERLRQDIAGAQSLVLTDYRGLSVAEKQDLTRRMREAGARYSVVKNSLFKLALGERGEQLAEQLIGPTAILYLGDDPISPTKALYAFIQETNKVSVKGAIIEGETYDADQVEELSKLPGRDELLGQVVAAVGSPLTGLVFTLQGVLNNVVWTLKALAEHKQEAEA